MTTWRTYLISVALFALVLAVFERPAVSRLERASCDLPTKVVVHGSTSPGSVCRAAASALEFLSACDLAPRRAVHVRVVDQLNGPVESALAYFDANAVEVVVPDVSAAEAMAQPEGFFGQPMDGELYQGLVAHEIAHAAVAPAIRTHTQVNPAPHEYIAYATLFATLPRELREEILRASPHEPPITVHELSALYWSLAPAEFGVKAHLHFAMPANGCRFLRGLISGRERLPTGLE